MIKQAKIIPHLWFDKEAVEAAKFYTTTFRDSKIKTITTLHDTPSGDSDIVTLDILGQEFMLISAGPFFKINPSVSFLIACETKKEVELLYSILSIGGSALMELGEYPFSEKYAWIQDKYGVSWQLFFDKPGTIKQKITPTIMFVGKQAGKTKDAIQFYTLVFKDAKVGEILYYKQGEDPDKEGSIKHAAFTLEKYDFAAMDSAYPHEFGFNEAISFMVRCANQKEIDYYWDKLSAVPEAEQCGWLKDKFGISWQIVPAIMDKMMQSGDKKQLSKVTEAFLKMKKFNIAKLEEAYGTPLK